MGDLARISSSTGWSSGDRANGVPQSDNKCSSMGLRKDLAARASAFINAQ